MRMIKRSILTALVACICLYRVLVTAEDSGKITLKWEKISVKIENEPTFSLMVDPDDTVQSLLDDMNELEGMRFRLSGGNTLADWGAKLYEYIRAGTTLNLVRFEKQERYHTTKFIVRTRDGRELPVETQLDNSLSSLKDNITQWAGIAQEEQRLLLRGRELKDGRRLIDCVIYNGSVLDLGRPLEDCIRGVKIFVKTLSGATIEVEANLADTVNGLKEKIWDKEGVPAGVQRLSNDERVITGENRLCDLGLEAGSTVYMMLYSSRITSLDQVVRLQESPVARPDNSNRAPIFHEEENVGGEPVQRSRRRRRRLVSLYKDVRNWVTGNGPYKHGNLNLFDPVAYLRPNPDDADSIWSNLRDLEIASSPNASESDRQWGPVLRARAKLSSAIRPYRLAANVISVKPRLYPSITLGGGSTDVSQEQLVPLGADVNNWAPDAFTDADVMRLFEVAERVRQVLASDAQSGEGTLSFGSQWQINRAILLTYHEALAGYPPSVDYNRPKEGEECGICRDGLAAESAIKLACEHTFHADCILPWVSNLYHQRRVTSCPYCRQKFMFPYEIQGKVELETPELRRNQDE